MNFQNSIKVCFQKYGTFEGRAQRSEYWFFTLFVFLLFLGAQLIDLMLGTTFEIGGKSLTYGYIYGLTVLILFVPSLSVTVRRFHDLNRSGWWFLLALVPIIGAIIILIWFCLKGTEGVNNYGRDPLSEQTGQVPA